MLEEKDINLIMDRVRAEFVTRSECDNQMKSMRESYHGIDVRLAVIENEVTKSTKLQWIELTAVITAIVGAFMTLILK